MNVEIEIPINATVECSDGLCGRTTHVILSPHTQRVTHLVVKERAFPHADHLVPVEMVQETESHLVRLRASRNEVHHMEPFTEVRFLTPDQYAGGYPAESVLFWPGTYGVGYTMGTSLPPMITETDEHTPPGEVSVGRGTRVEARDGRVGTVDDFVVDPATERITHLVLRKGHLWGERDVTIPVESIGHIDEDAVRLELDKHAIGELPSIPAGAR
jgi:sporulation protein YlmC with PRC-barrel domain